jgi:hypothetical protein
MEAASIMNVSWRQPWNELTSTFTQTISSAAAKYQWTSEQQRNLYALSENLVMLMQRVRDLHVFKNGAYTKGAVVIHTCHVLFVMATFFQIANEISTVDIRARDASTQTYDAIRRMLSPQLLQRRFTENYDHIHSDDYALDPVNLRHALAVLQICCNRCGQRGCVQFCIDPSCNKKRAKAEVMDQATWIANGKKRTVGGYESYVSSCQSSKDEVYYSKNQWEISYSRPPAVAHSFRV